MILKNNILKNLFYFLLFFPFSLFSQHAELGVFAGPYLSNQNLINQSGRKGAGLDFTHHFNSKEYISSKILYGETDFYYDFYDDLLNTTPGNDTNTILDDWNVSLLYGRNFWLNENFSISADAGLGLIISDDGWVGFLQVSNPDTGSSYSIPLSKESGFTVGFPLSTGINYNTSNKRWRFQLGGGGTVEPDYGIISLYFGPKVSMALGKIRE